jgi:hypothetical protein
MDIDLDPSPAVLRAIHRGQVPDLLAKVERAGEEVASRCRRLGLVPWRLYQVNRRVRSASRVSSRAKPIAFAPARVIETASTGARSTRPLNIGIDPMPSVEVPLDPLMDIESVPACDGYSGFSAAVEAGGLVRAGCWSHGRRGVKEALEAGGRAAAPLLTVIGRLFRIERAVASRAKRDGLDRAALPELRESVLTRRSTRMLDQVHAEAARLEHDRSTLPKPRVGKAVAYLFNQRRERRSLRATRACRCTTMMRSATCGTWPWAGRTDSSSVRSAVAKWAAACYRGCCPRKPRGSIWSGISKTCSIASTIRRRASRRWRRRLGLKGGGSRLRVEAAESAAWTG